MTLPERPLRIWPLAALWLLTAPLTDSALAAEPLSFTAPMRRSGGTCYMSLQPLIAGEAADDDSVRIVWSCTLDLPPDIARTAGYSAVGGLLEFQVTAQDSVLAVGKAVTGGMRWGQAYTFSDTLALPASVEIGQLVPRWQLTCGGKPMGALSCGPVSRVEQKGMKP